MIKALLDFLLSIKTAFGLFLICIALCLIGSIVLPANLAFFSGIDDTPLFRWLSETGHAGLTWWIYAFVAAMAVLALSTVACTIEALLSRALRLNLALRLPTQVMHLGVLLVMLGHLLTAWIGTRVDVPVTKGADAVVTEGVALRLMDVRTRTDENGYDTDWEADIEADGIKGTLRPARPMGVHGAGLYLKSVTMLKGEAPTALIGVARDPGAAWALLGGLLVSAGGAGFVLTRRRAAEPQL